MVCKVSIVIPGSDHAGAILNTTAIPRIGDRLSLAAVTVEVVEVVELEASAKVTKSAPVPTSGRARLKSELLSTQNRYTIQDVDGLLLGPVRIGTIRDLIEAGVIQRHAKIAKNDSRFMRADEITEIRFLFVRLAQKP